VKDFATAASLVLVIEGIIYALAPGMMQRMVAQLAVLPPTALRLAGLSAACVGVIGVWLIRGH
jgi:uncharacterized protein YjeT (DUF2065 family)